MLAPLKWLVTQKIYFFVSVLYWWGKPYKKQISECPATLSIKEKKLGWSRIESPVKDRHFLSVWKGFVNAKKEKCV